MIQMSSQYTVYAYRKSCASLVNSERRTHLLITSLEAVIQIATSAELTAANGVLFGGAFVEKNKSSQNYFGDGR